MGAGVPIGGLLYCYFSCSRGRSQEWELKQVTQFSLDRSLIGHLSCFSKSFDTLVVGGGDSCSFMLWSFYLDKNRLRTRLQSFNIFNIRGQCWNNLRGRLTLTGTCSQKQDLYRPSVNCSGRSLLHVMYL